MAITTRLEPRLSEAAALFPDKLAVQCGERRLTYQQLLQALGSVADQVGSLAGRRVLLLLPDGIPAYLCHLRFFLDGALVVPVTSQATTARIRSLCGRAQPHIVVTNHLLRARHATALDGIDCLLVSSEEDESPWSCRFERVGSPSRMTHEAATDLRLLVFTSGSTGEPKGVCLSESNVLAAAAMNVSFLELGPERKSLITVPLYDYYGFIQIYSHLLAQSGCILGESISFPQQIFQRIRNDEVTDLVLVPHTLREMLRVIQGERLESFRRLRCITSSSDVLTADLLSQAFAAASDLNVFNIYGLTEAGRACYRRIDVSSKPSGSIGRAAPGVEITIDAPPGEPGEIVIKGPNVMRGYFRGIENDRIALTTCTEMRTGDIGFYDEDREIVLVGRRDHMFNIKGFKIHPTEIECIALEVPGVVEALARPALRDNGNESICLEIVPANALFNTAAIRDHLRRNLLPVFFPSEITVVPSLKRTELGFKVIRATQRV